MSAGVQFRIPIPTRSPLTFWGRKLEAGHALDVKLSDPSPGRSGVVIPRDAIMAIGASSEVLIHTGFGSLTPASVECGDAFRADAPLSPGALFATETENLVEVRRGLAAGERVVRDIQALSKVDDSIRAAMLGFWEPGELPN